MVVFGAFSRRSKADSAGFEKHDSSIGSAARRPAFGARETRPGERVVAPGSVPCYSAVGSGVREMPDQ
jgi:hypothetical protein